jgi:hypothetical protein
MSLLFSSVTVGVDWVSNMKRKRSSGQIIVIAALIIALIIISTELYVYELGNTTAEANNDSFNDYILAIRLGSQHIVTGSLANVSQRGPNQTLVVNLEKWDSLMSMQYNLGRTVLNSTPYEMQHYSSGIKILWGSDGLGVSSGVSSACADFDLRISDREVNVNVTYAINVTTTLLVQGTYRVIQGDEEQVNVTCNLLNEGKPAIAENITLYYEDLDNWLMPGPLNNYGNGTYSISFVAENPPSNIDVSVQAYDQRGIYVQANVTCIEIRMPM